MRRATSSVVAIVSGLVSSARTISTSFIRGTGLKKCMPTTRAGDCNRGGDLGDGQGRGVGGEDDLGAAGPVEAREGVELQAHVLGHGLDHEVGLADARLEVGGGAQAPARRGGRVGRELAPRHALVEVLRDLGQGLLEGARRRRRPAWSRSRRRRRRGRSLAP